MKTVGVIGGLGPETTAEFYLSVSFSCQEKNKANRPLILIYNVPLRYDVETEFITKGVGAEKYLPYLLDAAKLLEKAGADFIVMPCNSMHIFISEIRNAVKIPVLSIVEETTAFLAGKGIRKVGLLATPSSVKKGLYASALKEAGIDCVLPDAFEQAKIGKAISKLVQGRHSNREREALLGVISGFQKKGVEHVILACTDLQLLIPEKEGMQVFDTMKILADATVREILKK